MDAVIVYALIKRCGLSLYKSLPASCRSPLRFVDETFPIESTSVGIGDIQYDFTIGKKYNQEPKLHEDGEFHIYSDESSDDQDEESTENDENSSVEEFEEPNNYENSNNVTN